ncbi:PREDICTED: G patch domain and KOW motifs-containing protein [Rhagoletis zephyria]|uniref:G patch domain and KOW motifs-containing protein n=1 Tax=Rhagoletis zephyria TaxID=28612 RepID=UPI00081197D4|nr:PREDICTED: G patch domain and KOW motifs-containing protein [Rhagoletis zephyria]
MDIKKISFGFSKTAKKCNLLSTSKGKEKEEPKVELIKCLEGHEIKLFEEKKEEPPMVIPLKEDTKTSAALASLIKRRAVLLGESDEPISKVNTETNGTSGKVINESLEERAARELLASVQGNDDGPVDKNLVLPTLKADELPLEGAKQSSIDDYENVPIEQFGKAMLRGMGWVEPIQKKGGPPEDEMPFVRPKGMGLGADKALKKQPLLVAPEKNEVLEIKKQAFVRILGGKHKDMYGQIEGFDDHAARVIVKMAIGGNKEAFNEFLCQPVAKKEYAQYGKCINTAKYEEYKKMENEHGQIIIKQEDTEKKPRPVKEVRKVEDEYQRGDDDKRKADNKARDRRDERRKTEEKQRPEHRSKSRHHGTEDHSYNGNRDDDDRRCDDYRSSNSRRYALEQHDVSSRRNRYDERRNERDQSKRRSRERNNRTEIESAPSASGSSSRRQQYTDDTSASSGTDSDSDSAYERKAKKKSSHKSKAKKKSSKKSKRKHRHRTSDTETSSGSDSEREEDSYRREKKQHKKKTKKSKKPRSRSRSHDRSSRR